MGTKDVNGKPKKYKKGGILSKKFLSGKKEVKGRTKKKYTLTKGIDSKVLKGVSPTDPTNSVKKPSKKTQYSYRGQFLSNRQVDLLKDCRRYFVGRGYFISYSKLTVLLFDYIRHELGIDDEYLIPVGKDRLIIDFSKVGLNFTKSSNVWFSTDKNIVKFNNMGICKYYIKNPLGSLDHVEFGRSMYLHNKYQSMWFDAAFSYREIAGISDSLKLFFSFNFELRSGIVLLDYSYNGVDVAPSDKVEKDIVYKILYNDNYVD